MTLDADLVARLDRLYATVRHAVERRRLDDPQPHDPFRGLYLSEDHVDRLLDDDDESEFETDLLVETTRPTSVLGRLSQRFHLDELELTAFVIALAPDIDDRIEQLYGYLHDDITRRRASPGLCVELCGRSAADAVARLAVSSAGTLGQSGLLRIDDADRPFLTRSLRVPDRVVDHVLGNDLPPVELRDIAIPTSHRRTTQSTGLARALTDGITLVHLRERAPNSDGLGIACAALRETGRDGIVSIDLGRVAPEQRFHLADIARREAQLIDGGLVVVGSDALELPLRRMLARSGVITFLIGSKPFDPEASHVAPLALDVSPPSTEEQTESWGHTLGDDAALAPGSFRMSGPQIARATESARLHAAAAGRQLTRDHLLVGARQQNSSGLERLARRIEPAAGWGQIILDAATAKQLQQLKDRVEFRSEVLDGWGLRRAGGRGEGIVALFAGASGTGKTLAAEVIAFELGLELYVINLATVVDKYIGETEKNLQRIFDEAEGNNAILFFDEADALFGKRSEVNDARDRYANVEVAYLLQRLESFDGLGVLATNLKTNLDDAFARRLSIVVDFPDPEPDVRRGLWDFLIGRVPLDHDVDLDFCAQQFELSGGNIRNVVLAAAYLGAAEGGKVRMSHIIEATTVEYNKLGRLCLEREFGPYYHLVRGDNGLPARR